MPKSPVRPMFLLETYQFPTAVEQVVGGGRKKTKVENCKKILRTFNLVAVKEKRNPNSSWTTARLTNITTSISHNSTNTDPTSAVSQMLRPVTWCLNPPVRRWRCWVTLIGPHCPQSPKKVTPEMGSVLTMPPPQETVLSQVLSPMGNQTPDQRCRGKDKRLLGYGISSTAAQTRGEEMRVKRHSPGGLREATKRNREKAPITHQLTALKRESYTTGPPT